MNQSLNMGSSPNTTLDEIGYKIEALKQGISELSAESAQNVERLRALAQELSASLKIYFALSTSNRKSKQSKED